MVLKSKRELKRESEKYINMCHGSCYELFIIIHNLLVFWFTIRDLSRVPREGVRGCG